MPGAVWSDGAWVASCRGSSSLVEERRWWRSLSRYPRTPPVWDGRRRLRTSLVLDPAEAAGLLDVGLVEDVPGHRVVVELRVLVRADGVAVHVDRLRIAAPRRQRALALRE